MLKKVKDWLWLIGGAALAVLAAVLGTNSFLTKRSRRKNREEMAEVIMLAEAERAEKLEELDRQATTAAIVAEHLKTEGEIADDIAHTNLVEFLNTRTGHSKN